MKRPDEADSAAPRMLRSLAQEWSYPLLLVALCALVYYRLAGYEFVGIDDQIHLLNNPYVNPPTWAGLGHLWTNVYEGLYIPVSYTLFALLALGARVRHNSSVDYDPSITLNPHIFHIANIVLHIFNVLLVWVLLRRIVKSAPAAAMGAALFAVHPLQVESVAWISELRGLLSGAFVLASLTAYTSRLRGRYILATVFFALSVLAKPSAVVAPVLALLVDRVILPRPWKAYARELAPWAAISIVFLCLTRSAQPVSTGVSAPLWARPIVALDALAFYADKIVLPIRLCLDYGRAPMEVIGHRGEWAVCLVPIGLALVAAAARKFCAIASSAMLFSLVALGPVLGLVPFSYQYYSTVSDRYAYLALIGPAIIVSEIVSRFVFSPAKSRALFAACIALLLISIRLTTSECWAWANTAALIRHTLVQNSGSRLMQMIALLDLGDADYNAHRPAQALSKYEQLIVNRPDYAPAHYNAGNALLQMGLTDRAIGEFQTAIRLDPTDALYYMNYGNALSDKGENMAALSNYDRAITLNSTLRKVHFNKGSVLMKIGALDAALREFDSEIVNDEYVSAYVNKGIVLIELNRPAEAAGALQSAIAIGPPTSSWFTNLAVAQIALGRKSDARASVVHALALSPGDETASSILQMLDHGGKR